MTLERGLSETYPLEEKDFPGWPGRRSSKIFVRASSPGGGFSFGILAQTKYDFSLPKESFRKKFSRRGKLGGKEKSGRVPKKPLERERDSLRLGKKDASP